MQVWDLATRIYHWLQAVLFFGLVVTGFLNVGPHEILGIGLFTLVLWRILLGVWGSDTSRFMLFIRSPKVFINSLYCTSKPTVGHSPAGGWMVALMLIALVIQCGTGFILAGFLDDLPLIAGWVEEIDFSIVESIHSILLVILPGLVCIHIMAILFYKFNRKPLVWAMVTGRMDKCDGAETPNFISNRSAFLMLIAALLVTIAIIA